MSIAAKGVILEIVTLLEAFFHTWNQFENIAYFSVYTAGTVFGK
jgi:hypothetical protein